MSGSAPSRWHALWLMLCCCLPALAQWPTPMQRQATVEYRETPDGPWKVVPPQFLAQLPPRGTTPTPRTSPAPTRPLPTPVTPSIPVSSGYRWRITIEAWDAGNQAWAPPQRYEVTGEVACRLLIDSPCGIRVERRLTP